MNVTNKNFKKEITTVVLLAGLNNMLKNIQECNPSKPRIKWNSKANKFVAYFIIDMLNAKTMTSIKTTFKDKRVSTRNHIATVEDKLLVSIDITTNY